MGNIAFVASTLPVPILKYKLNEWDIDEIIVSSVKLQKPFIFLLNNTNIKLTISPTKSLNNFIFILFKLLKSFFLKKNIYFFHECCWFNFDFLIDYINVKAFFYPQVTLKSFEKVNNVKIQSKYQRYILYFSNSIKKFDQYKVIEDNNEGYYYVLSKKNYKKNVQVFSISDSLNFRIKKSLYSFDTKNILILIGKETINDNILSNIYEKIIFNLTLNGYLVSIKNHPRDSSRLKINDQYVHKEYDADLPFELIQDSFKCIIGCASTSLINKSQPVFSIINFTGMESNLVKLRINHLLEIAGSDFIIFPNSIEDLINKINDLGKY